MFHWLILLYVSMLCGVFSTNLCFLGLFGTFPDVRLSQSDYSAPGSCLQ
uniref:Uncharacterized protein n=1 Tax=Faecalibaculum rodentium TaxID=1702221 RepID=A0A140DSE2_9FIRM|nr:hypothetical protein AALO17_04350 [Faecalibaculum rodentium]